MADDNFSYNADCSASNSPAPSSIVPAEGIEPAHINSLEPITVPQPQVQSPISPQAPMPQKKSDRFLGLIRNLRLKRPTWRLVSLIVLVLILFIAFFGSKLITWQKQRGFFPTNQVTSPELLKDDYLTGSINQDNYLRQLLYANFDRSLLDDKYRVAKKDIFPSLDLSQFPDDKVISNKTKDALVKYLLAPRVSLSPTRTFDSDGKIISSSFQNEVPFVSSANAAKPSAELASLDQRVYSRSGKFVIWFTEKGKNKVKKTYALQTANDVDNVYSSYKNKLGLNGSVDFKYMYGDIQTAISNVNKIEESAGKIPVYLINDGSDANVGAFYMTSSMPDWILALMYQPLPIIGVPAIQGQPIFPYILLKPSAVDNYQELKAIYSHELVHLAQDMACNWDISCKKSGKFTSETTANWLGAEENPDTTIFRDYHLSKYFSGENTKCGVSMALDKNDGYCTYTFLEFLNGVLDAKTIFGSYRAESAIGYIYSKVTNFSKLFSDFAIKNIKNDYRYASFNTNRLPSPYEANITSTDKYIASTAIHYYYLQTSDLVDKVIKIKNTSTSSDLYLTILARNTNIITNVIVPTNKGFKTIYQDKLVGEYTIKSEDYSKYNEIAIILSNGNTTMGAKYTIEKMSGEIVAIDEIEKAPNCQKVGTYSSIFDFFGQLSAQFSGLYKMLADLNASGALKATVDGQGGAVATTALQNESAVYDRITAQLNTAGTKQGGNGILMCGYPVLANIDEKSAHDNIYSKFGGFKKLLFGYSNVDDKDPNVHGSAFSSYTLKEGLNIFFVVTNYQAWGQSVDPATGKRYMGAMFNIKFEKFSF